MELQAAEKRIRALLSGLEQEGQLTEEILSGQHDEVGLLNVGLLLDGNSTLYFLNSSIGSYFNGVPLNK